MSIDIAKIKFPVNPITRENHEAFSALSIKFKDEKENKISELWKKFIDKLSNFNHIDLPMVKFKNGENYELELIVIDKKSYDALISHYDELKKDMQTMNEMFKNLKGKQ